MLAIIPVAAAAYVATNLDNLSLFVLLLTRYRDRERRVVAGYIAGAATLLAAGFLIGRAAETIPVEYLGLLGCVPISVGIHGLVGLFGKASAPGQARQARTRFAGRALLASLGTQLGNGSDTVLTFAALFADSNRISDLLIVATIASMAGLFAMLGVASLRRSAFARWIDRFAPRITPFILILVGAYILANTASDVLLD